MRVGTGYDVHRLVEGRKLILGGVEVPFEKGLLGHSDADVLAHAIADALLEISFVPGMLVFGAGHVCLIAWLWGLAAPSWWSLALWVAVYILTALLFRKELPTLGKLTVPFLLYPALLGGSMALGLPLVFLLGWEWWPVALGTLLFYISDMLVAKNQLAHWDDTWQKPIMALYWAALYLISMGLWVV